MGAAALLLLLLGRKQVASSLIFGCPLPLLATRCSGAAVAKVAATGSPLLVGDRFGKGRTTKMLLRPTADDSSYRAPVRVAQTRMAADTVGAAIREAWDLGESTASSLRPLVESASCSPSARAAAAAAAASTSGWAGLWEARIEHFEKVRWAGLRVRPYYELDDTGRIVSHVHVAFGTLRGWASASGRMKGAGDGSASVILVLDDFWVGADGPGPRTAPDEADAFDTFNRLLGRALFFEGLAAFPVEYADLENGIVGFRFTAFNSMIVSARAPEGRVPQRD